ncbi:MULTISPECIES: ABC transporter ATP-binding protein [Nitrincola]|uniref:Spermidine/putrescine import ATP-binding protein PotA n=1 Tax=Nitrincola nitratireducens TaxID=1229521 RepID=W9URD5_9GAMM|nr:MULTISPECIES: ABC transporter ATP-binding protein [Nitrincola]EXJ09654.1 Spermidine/putrescine import ATP-binding protein PotA [Nitrincola nitratireducens]
MAHLDIRQLQVGYGDKTILHGINLQVQKGEMIALLGPSGCGKTTLLNAICGFVPTQSGEVHIAGHEITQLPAERRNITMVFQSYALWPHMSVAQNISYGLKVRKIPKAQAHKRVLDLLSIVNLEGFENEKVTNLSGGQRQRVALARALAVEPDVLVLDEPLSNLDAKVRLSVRHELKALQKKLGFTSLIVTHDQEEALVMADRVAVLNQGRIEQLGTPEDIYQQPETPFVADFMGADNCIIYKTSEPNVQLHLPNRSTAQTFALYFRSSATQVQAFSNSKNEAGLTLSGLVEQTAFLGQQYRHTVRSGEQVLQADSRECWPIASQVSLFVPPQALHVFDLATHETSNAFQSNLRG